MAAAQHRQLDTSDEVRGVGHGRLDLVHMGGGDVGRLTLEPGWKWSTDLKPLARTEWCEAPHFQYHAAGTLHIKMADVQEFDAVPGDITALPAGHDAWVSAMNRWL